MKQFSYKDLSPKQRNIGIVAISALLIEGYFNPGLVNSIANGSSDLIVMAVLLIAFGYWIYRILKFLGWIYESGVRADEGIRQKVRRGE